MGFRFWLRLIFGAYLVCAPLTSWAGDSQSYTVRWSQFDTKLLRRVKTFQNAPALEASYGDYKRVHYQSAGLAMAALLNTHHVDPGKPGPAVVYLHGGFGLTPGELKVTDLFAEAGLIVMVPTWRGENQNPGYFECFLGEVADAKAAIRWLAAQPSVDADRIYVFGWSVGGGIAMNLALMDDIPVQTSGSSAGVYDLDLIKSWATEDDFIEFPYDYRDKHENFFRLPIYHLEDLMRDHYTFVGSEDGYAEIGALYRSLYPDAETRLRLIEVEGGHMQSLPGAVAGFLGVIGEDFKQFDDK